MMRSLVLLVLVLAGGGVSAQPDSTGAAGAFYPVADGPDTTAARFASGPGLAIVLTEYGFGLGALGRLRLSDDASLVLEGQFGAGRDEREQQFFVGFFGETVVPFKRNYVVLLPLHAGLERRLFRQRVEDNFRPFVLATAGPTVAFQWPYFRDGDGDGIRDEGEALAGPFGALRDGDLRLGAGATVALGAWFGRGRRLAQGVRFGYAAHYFARPVDLLELDPEVDTPSRRYFGTPVVSFHLVRLRP